MSIDDAVLFLQRAIDRGIRRLRRGSAPARTEKRLLIIQIDGLSRAVLEHALAIGRVPFMKRLLQHDYRMDPMSVGLPTSTPAFQMAAMYGVWPDIPGFHYYDRARSTDIHFPRAGHAKHVEATLAAGRRGILEGGSAYGCVFTGGAENNFFSFASLTRPSGRGILSALSPFVVIAWLLVKNIVLTLEELVRAAGRFLVNRAGDRHGWRWLTIKIGLSVWVREFFTMAVARDLYAGTPVVYVNFLDYDVSAHAFGPRSRRALRSLRSVDRAIKKLFRVVRRVPEHRYDVYILSDHGQASCTSYHDVSGGKRLERWIFDEFLEPARSGSATAGFRSGLVGALRSRRSQGGERLFQHFLNYVEEDFLRGADPEAHEQDGVRVIAAGPNAFLYVLDSAQPLDENALEARFPGLAERLSSSAGIGFLLLRSAEGPVCFCRGKRFRLTEAQPGPFAGRPDLRVVLKDIAELMRMPSAGDIVIYGTGAADGQISFIPERGAHAGPSIEEMQTFIIRPTHVTLPAPISHPVQLYDHFIRYQEA